MCGLVGYWERDGESAQADIIRRMLERQAHRGPDDRGIWIQGAVGLGLDRLSILDLSELGHQPFVTPDNQAVIAYNGEVYNWQALRQDLESEGVTFRSHCDTEVVLQALYHWGPVKAIPRLNGMFALAYFDRRHETLWLTRDRAGIKPLYLTNLPGTLAFASEAKALFAHPGVPCRPDVHAMATQVWYERLAGDWTAFEGVSTLLPGTTLEVSADAARTHTWFDVARDVEVDRILASRNEPFASQVTALKSRLENSVKLHLQSDAPLAVMCSGGLDSSLTTAIARRHKPDLVAFVAEVEEAPVAEALKAQQVAEHLGVDLQRIPISDAEYPDLWTRAAWHNDDPIFFYQNPLTLKVSQAVHDAGFKVLVTGEGADELFGGYPWQMNTGGMWRMRQWHARLLPNVAPLRFLGRIFQALAPFNFEELADQPFSRRSKLNHELPGAELVIDAGIRRNIARQLFDRLQPISNLGERALLARAFNDFYHHLRVLLNSNDKMTMATSVEMRVPFLENELIDFGLHLAPSAKIYRKSRKRIVQAAAEGLLPDNIIHAEKIGFSIPDKFWSGYEPLLRNSLVAELFKWRDADWDSRENIFRKRASLVHKVVTLEIWAQLYFNGQTPEAMAEKLRSVRKPTT